MNETDEDKEHGHFKDRYKKTLIDLMERRISAGILENEESIEGTIPGEISGHASTSTSERGSSAPVDPSISMHSIESTADMEPGISDKGVLQGIFHSTNSENVNEVDHSNNAYTISEVMLPSAYPLEATSFLLNQLDTTSKHDEEESPLLNVNATAIVLGILRNPEVEDNLHSPSSEFDACEQNSISQSNTSDTIPLLDPSIPPITPEPANEVTIIDQDSTEGENKTVDANISNSNCEIELSEQPSGHTENSEQRSVDSENSDQSSIDLENYAQNSVHSAEHETQTAPISQPLTVSDPSTSQELPNSTKKGKLTRFKRGWMFLKRIARSPNKQ